MNEERVKEKKGERNEERSGKRKGEDKGIKEEGIERRKLLV